MSIQPARGYLGISEVLARLREEFPDVSHSKIRFLEAEGLITPARSPSGYRRFGLADVDRLRYILAAQRDQYLPLRVIRERLQAPASGQAPGAGGSAPGGSAGSGGQAQLSRSELAAAAGVTDALLTELESFGLLRRTGRQYGADALAVARAAAALAAYGVEARHLRAVRAAAERESAMIESLVAPVARQRGAGAAETAAATAGELAALVGALHQALVDGALAEAGLRPGAAAAARPAGPARGEREPPLPARGASA